METKSDESAKFAFHEEQEFIKEALVKAARTALARPDQTPSSLVLGAHFLYAAQRLPLITEQIDVSLKWLFKHDTGWGMRTISISPHELTSEIAEGFLDGPQGTEHEFKTIFYVDYEKQSGLEDWELMNDFDYLLQVLDFEQGFEVEFVTDSDYLSDELFDESPVEWNRYFED
jgi:hypothetical protein